MEIAPQFQVRPAGDKPGALASFPYDRDLVERFRETFPRARWRQAEGVWFVPGVTAARRLDVWIAGELDALDRHADAKGRDAFAFDPLESPYLTVGDDLQVRTPYSRTVVERLRAIPFARWDPDGRAWRVPFRSYEALRADWPAIEAAARRNEPAAKRAREPSADERAQAAWLQGERRRRRLPVRADDPPPLGELVATEPFGVVAIEAVGLEPIDGAFEAAARRYAHVQGPLSDYVWADWRIPDIREVQAALRARAPEEPPAGAGWRAPAKADLRERLRRLREADRAARTRWASRDGAATSA